MRKLMTTALAASIVLPVLAVPVTASAQAWRGNAEREVRSAERDLRREQQDLRTAQRHGDRRDVRDARKDVRDARDDLRDARQDARRDARRDVRQDWREYRRSHRDVYHRSAYVGPRGYRYRPVNVGYRFAPAYYGDRYHVRDYARYRLPMPRAGQRWVRYGNDVVLVNVRSGRVLTVYNGFFW